MPMIAVYIIYHTETVAYKTIMFLITYVMSKIKCTPPKYQTNNEYNFFQSYQFNVPTTIPTK